MPKKKLKKELKTKRKKTRRSVQKYPMLEQSEKYNSRIKSDLLDIDYVDKLNEKEKEFLNNFLEETVNANFKHSGKRILPKKYKTHTVKKTGKKKKIEIHRQSCEYNNNHRNVDLMGVAKATGRLDYELKDNKFDKSKDLVEDYLISEIDKKKSKSGF